ncbi:hypothetical protein GF312_02470, partial [Candidatus Poribacteria bacterium]|nr:hypothetical protein [Candidatus Poribacteria bacterium]
NIMWDNYPQEIYFRATDAPCTVNVSYSDVEGGEIAVVTNSNGTLNWSSSNIYADPLFASYSLSANSPCIGAGFDSINVPDTDILGNPRPGPGGSSPDIGAYENSLGSPTRPNTFYVSITGDDETGDVGEENPFASIQRAIEASWNGDTIIVKDGTYTGSGNRNMDFLGKAITVKSENGAENCTINCQQSGRAFRFHRGEGSSSILQGFTIINGSVFGTWPEGCGGAIECINGSSPMILNNIITNNKAQNAGGGIRCDNSSPIIASNIIQYNDAIAGGGIRCNSQSDSQISNNEIIGNTATNYGAGISIAHSSDPDIANNIITDNTAGYGAGGIRIVELSSALIRNNLITNNSAEDGAAIYLSYRASAELINNTVVDNNGINGGGIFLYGDCIATIVNTIFWNNGPNEINLNDSPPFTFSSFFSGSFGLDYILDEPCEINISYSDVEGGLENIVVEDDGTVNWDASNISADPLLDNYRLSDFSLCIGAGLEVTNMPGTDLDGNPRPNPEDSNPDIGAYESALGESYNLILITPNGGEIWAGGSSQEISWDASGAAVDHIRILYSANGGATYPETLTPDTENDGSYVWNPVHTLNSDTIRIKIIGEDAGNNELMYTTSADNFTIDSTNPETTVVLDGTEGENGWYTSDVNVTLNSSDNLSGVSQTTYKINDGSWQTYIEPFTVTGSTVYYKSEDNAGNIEDEKSVEVNIDKTPPSTPSVTDDGIYTGPTKGLHATWNSGDAESGISEYEYSIESQAGTVIVDWTSAGVATEVTRADLSLTRGETYYFKVNSKNGAGLKSLASGSSDGIIYDDSKPIVEITLNGTKGENNWYISNVNVTMIASDTGSNVKSLQYKINEGEWQEYEGTFSASASPVYYEAVDNAGNSTGVKPVSYFDGETEIELKIDKTPPPAPVVTDDGDFAGLTNQLHATWVCEDNESPIVDYEYAVGTSQNSYDIYPWTSMGSSDTEVTVTGLSLENGSTYYISVKALNEAGFTSSPGSSDGITLDSTPPTKPLIFDDGNYTNTLEELNATWTAAQDNDSGIVDYQYSVGTTTGGTDILDWTSLGVVTSVNITELSLTEGITYYINLKAFNGAGLNSEVATTDGITPDITPPLTEINLDGIQGESGWWGSDVTVTFNPTDNLSGVEETRYKIDEGEWQVYEEGLVLTGSTLYYLSEDVVGNIEEEKSIDINIDKTQPSTPVVTDDGDFTMITTHLHAEWTESQDNESGIVKYQYAIGTSPGGNEVTNWTSTGLNTTVSKGGLNLLQNTTYYISVKAENGAGLLSDAGVSDGIKVDTTPPPKPIVDDFGDYTNSSDQIDADWSDSEDPESGITDNEYSLGITQGGIEIIPWTSSGDNSSISITELELAEGTTYYVNTRTTNGVGLVSPVGFSDGITPDFTPPETEIELSGIMGENNWWSTDVEITLTATDNLSGIKQIYYKVNDGEWLIYPAEGVTLTGSTFYYKAEDNAGNIETEKSIEIDIDKTPPSIPVITDEGNFTKSLDTLNFSWTESNDTESGVVNYMYSTGTQQDGSDMIDWTSLGLATELNLTDLTLSNGVTYYLGIKVENGAGMLSDIALSDGITVDVDPPVTTAQLDGIEGENGWYVSNINVSLLAEDDLSGVDNTEFKINDGEWGLYNTPINLVESSTIYFRSTDNMGNLETEKTLDILIDKTNPSAPTVMDDGSSTNSNNELHAWWTGSEDPESGILEYQYSIGTAPGANDTLDWTSGDTTPSGISIIDLVSIDGEVTVTDLTLFNGQIYFFNVKAKNNAGLWSDVGTSDGIVVNSFIDQRIIQLTEGWNLISLCLQPQNNNIESVLKPIEGLYRSVYTYDPLSEEWLQYSPDMLYWDIATIDVGQAYWIDMAEDAILTITGDPIENTSIQMYAGWNTVGYNSINPQTMQTGLASIGPKVLAVYTYDNITGSFLMYSPLVPYLSNLEYLVPGKGYLIYLDSDGEWVLP